MLKRSFFVWLFIALVATAFTIPLLQYRGVLYGSKVADANFIFDYIEMWWRKAVRRLTGQVGPAENVTINEEEAQTYTMPTTKPKNSIYDVVSNIKKERSEYAQRILAYIEESGLPNKSAQIDLLIVPEEIYLTFYWDETSLMIYDGWIGDQNAKEYAVATATSNVVMQLYQNRDNPSSLRSMVLQAEGNGNLSYSFKRLNPPETLESSLMGVELVSSLISIVGWVMVFLKRRRI